MAEKRYRTRKTQAQDLKKTKLSQIENIDELFEYAQTVPDQQLKWMDAIQQALKTWKKLVIDNPELRKELLAVLGNDRRRWSRIALAIAMYLAVIDVGADMLEHLKSQAMVQTIAGVRNVAIAGKSKGFPGANLEGGHGISQWAYELAALSMLKVVTDYLDDAAGYFVDFLGAPHPPMHVVQTIERRGKRNEGESKKLKLKRSDKKTDAGGDVSESDDQAPSRSSRPGRQRKRRVVDSDDEAEDTPTTTPNKRPRIDEDELPENSGDELFVSRSTDDIDQLAATPLNDAEFDSEEIQTAILESLKPDDNNKRRGSVSETGRPSKEQKTQQSRRFNGPFGEDSDDEDGVATQSSSTDQSQHANTASSSNQQQSGDQTADTQQHSSPQAPEQ